MNQLDQILNQYPALVWVFFAWSIFWKGRALWIAAKKASLYWFVALLLINTAGLLDIAYVYFFSKRDIKLPQFSKLPFLRK
ncbi:hypothetical protein HY389_01155 [Candidatus Daviesbacteria bacterium]|nr:hypothetical protein [Candidatus Daviesbacteria bacterium]